MFQSGDETSSILLSWWKGLEHDKGERAFMRRASAPGEVVFSPAYHRLLSQLQRDGRYIDREALAGVAGLAAHVKGHTDGASLSKQMAKPRSSGSGARVSGLRFRRLLAVSDRGELYPLMIRVIRLLGDQVNLVSLANGVYWWNDKTDKTKKDWAYDYYATAPSEK